MNEAGDLRLLLASRYPLVIATVDDETRFIQVLANAAQALGLAVWTWTATKGLVREGQPSQYGTTDPGRALDFVAEVPAPGVFLFADFHHAVREPALVRRVKEFAQRRRSGQTLVLTGPQPFLPSELQGLALAWTLPPRTGEEVEAHVRRTLDELSARGVPVSLDRAGVASMAKSLKGLSAVEAEHMLLRAAARDGKVAVDDIAFVQEAKAAVLQAGGVLELIEADEVTLDAVGGMEGLKRWLHLRGRALEPDAIAYGLDAPRGVLITGVPGCGKSLAAKALARSWDRPLILLDPSRLFGPYVGESEQRLEQALKQVESMAPAVLWLDEMEKGFAVGGEADGGVSRRLLGTWLRWMQERPPGVFVVATSNDVSALPPELLRKGRFDEIFFVDLPEREDRAQIFRLHLARRGRDPGAFGIAELAEASEDFSGAEIEAAVVGALYRSYGEKRELTTADVLEEMRSTIPLARTRAEDVARLRAWATERAVRA
jgi:ATP-dependent 26S proteasome regulatory subunit